MGKGNITLPPVKKPPLINEDQRIADEKKISAVINKGGSPTRPTETNGSTFKNFNIKLLESELAQINELRGQRPKPRGQKSPGISLQGWLLEAIYEKIENETQKYYTETKV